MKRLVWLFLVLITQVSTAQDIQWANDIINFSTQLDVTSNSAKQILGEPNAGEGHSARAWQPSLDIRRENIHVGFTTPIQVKQITIVENYNPGSVYRVSLYDEVGTAYNVYSAEAQSLEVSNRIFTIELDELTPYKVHSVKISIDCRTTPGEQQIDAVGISSSIVKITKAKPKTADIQFYSQLEKLSNNINSSAEELSPLISPDGKTLYFCRDGHPETYGEQEIWYSKLVNNSWSPAIRMSRPLNNANSNFVNSITPDGNMMLLGNQYFFKKKGSEDFEESKKRVRQIRKGKRENDLLDISDLIAHPENYEEVNSYGSGFSLSINTSKGWSYPFNSVIDSYSNTNRYVNYFLTNNSNTIIMSIESEGGQGELDLCFSNLLPDGTWTKPENMGTDINTIANDGTPFLASDNKTLYFSSEGRPGFGGRDIYMTKRLDDSWKKWSEPLNMGPVINSEGWDAYFTIPAKGDYAYLVRDGDIYRVRLNEELKPEPVVLLSGKVLNKKTNEPLQVDISYEDLETGKEIGAASTNPETGEYKIILPAGKKYGCISHLEGFYPINEFIDVRALKEYTEVDKNLFMVPIEKGEIIRLNNIFFDFAKATLQKESFPELNRVAELMQTNLSLSIQINGHTDNVGDDTSNLNLSQSRAQAVVAYLTSKGIEKARLVAKGYGETKPIATNNTEEGKAINRRVEFLIL